MSLFETFDMLPVMQSLGWTLLHFIWQGVLIAALVAVVLTLLPGKRPETRYLVCLGGMLAMIVAPAVTLTLVWSEATTGGATTTLPIGIGESDVWARLTPVLPGVTIVWLVGVLALQTRLVLHWSHAQHLKRFGVRAAPVTWQRSTRALAEQLGIRRTVQVFESSLAASPMLIGWLQPVILLPTTALTGLTPAQLRAVIAHELTHVRRHDYFVNLVQAVWETLLFYHPAVWWLSNRIRAEREYCCDDVAVDVTGDALDYARALASLDALRDDACEPVMASTGGSLMDRIRRLIGMSALPAGRVGGWMGPMMVALSVTTAAAAVVLNVTAAEVTPDDRFSKEVRPIDRVDLVNILRTHGDPNADTIAVLRDSGLDNRVLLKVMDELGTSPDLLDAVEHRAHQLDIVESRMEQSRVRIAEALASGDLTAAEAQERLAMARAEIKAALHRENAEHAGAHGDGEIAFFGEARVQQRTEEAALAEHERELVELEQHRREALIDHVSARILDAQAWVKDALDCGDITEEEARQRLWRMEFEFDALQNRELGDVVLLPPPADRDVAFGEDVIVELHPMHEHQEDLAELELEHMQHAERHLVELRERGEAEDQFKAELHRMHEGRQAARIEVALKAAEAHVAERVAAGELDRARAHEHLVVIRERLSNAERGELTRVVRDRRLPSEHREHAAAVKLDRLKAKLDAEVKAGRISEAEARAHIMKMKGDLAAAREAMMLREVRVTSADRAALLETVRASRAELEAAIEAGRQSGAEAMRRLEHLKQAEEDLSVKPKADTAEKTLQ